MQIVLCRDAAEAADLASAKIVAALARKPDLVLGLCTGSTPIPVYQRLVAAHRERGLSFARVRTFNLDEYLDLAPDHPQSYRSFMRRELFDHVDLHPARCHFPPAGGGELEARCEDFERHIAEAGGIDLQLLGIGSNGHIGFNEPTSSLASRTRVKTLTERTLKDNARFYGPGEVQPTLAVTMGIGTILDARVIVLQATGAKKAEAVQRMVEGPVSSMFPGSALQLHPRATVLLDPEAAALLSMREYYQRARDYELVLRSEGRL